MNATESKPTSFGELVTAELARARAKFGLIRCWHEALGVILEEFEEFKDEVKRKGGSPARELVQLAAMCQRATEDLHAVEVAIADEMLRRIAEGR